MATVERNGQGSFVVKIEGQRALYVAPGKLGDNLTALQNLHEEAKNYRGEVKTKMGDTELKLHDTGIFSTSLVLDMNSGSYSDRTYKSIEVAQLPDVIQAVQDFVDEESGRVVDNTRVGELRRLLGNKIK